VASSRVKIWLLVSAALVPLLIVVWLLGGWVGARGADLWVLRLGLGAACTALAVGIGVWLQGRLPKEQPAHVGGDELDATFATARTRLAATRVAGTASLSQLPLVLILGPAGGAKTSTVVNSGLEPDLLAGEAFHGDRVAPTRWANLWYTQKTILLEVGAPVAADVGRWQRLVRYARPNRLMALLPGRAQASRLAVVCFSCEELVKPGSATAVPAAAAELRKALVELAQEFGIRLPVYVLFTKADRVPFFAEFMRNLSREEAREVLGATLTWPPATTPGVYGEREFQRINEAFERLYQSLADKRVPLLARERDAAQRGDVYEFPREFRKIIPVASQFLLDLCRPSQLQVNPVLRGFYLTGVRPRIVSDVGPPVPERAAAPGGLRVGATQIFDAGELPTPQAAQPAALGGRKVAEWVFLGRFFREIVLGDRVAKVAALGSRRVNLLRRVALATAAGLSVFWLLGQPISCAYNRTLAGRAVGALRDLQVGQLREGELAGLDALRNLDAGRAQLERLADYQRRGAPLRMRFGLYQGAHLYQELGKKYLTEFERVLLEPTRQSLQRALRTTVDSGGTQGRAHELLRAYLMTTTHPDRIEAPFLTPILLRQWQGTWQLDSQRRGLADQQFEFYAAKLCPAGACQPGRADQAIVDRARNFLKDFTAPEALYQQMVAQANGGTLAVRFTAEALYDSLEVPGAFTPAGWEAAVRYLADEDNFLTEDWVLEQPAGDPSRIRETLRSMYRQEYVLRWRKFVEAGVLASFTRGNAGDRLKELAAPQTSPLVRMLALVARNTDIDRENVGRFFQPVHVLAPPGAKDSTTELMKPYLSALRDLQVLVEDAATAAPAEAQQLSEKIAQSARAARTVVGQLEDSFRPEGEGVAVGAAVGKLLGTPIDRVDGLMRGLPGMAVNSIAERFCRAFDPLTSHFPFNPAGTDVDLKDFGAMFQPEEGELSRFYTDALRDVLVRSGSQFTARQGSRVSPTFLAFFNRAAAVSAALWKSENPDPQFDFVLQVQPPAGAPRITLSMSGQRAVWEQRHRPVGTFRWMGEPGQVALTAQLRGVETDLRTFTGVWAIFRLFRDATGWRPAAGESGSYLVQLNYPDRGVTLDAQLNVGGRTPILRSDFFAGMRCVSRVIQ
jgi:type VI secretion system protein ImpL